MQLVNSVKPDDNNSMSELKQILSEALMKKGIFWKNSASIFSIFKEKEVKLTFMSQIQKVNDIKTTIEGKLMFNLIIEALDILGLTFSKSVLLSEASLKQSETDSFELFKQKQLNINVNDNSSSNKSKETPIIMTSEMRTEKAIGDFKNRNNDILKKLDSIINLDNDTNRDNNNINNGDFDFGPNYEENSDELIEEVSLLDIQNNSLISHDEILKESQIIDAEAAARSLLNNNEPSLKGIQKDNKYKVEEDSEIEIVSEVSKEDEFIDNYKKIDGTSEINSDLLSTKEEKNSTFNNLTSAIDDPTEVRKLATKSLIDDIKNKLENITEEKIENNPENDLKKAEQQISIDNINLNSQNLR
ncbi:hypothetical protein LY90DRAFT_697310 [Neocallimastix californiae]|uniref:Uncharacterized protein n=1 Tax=Neocallimastix californiae TaxID=1754190 RepID=A0A1Y2FHE0_9FUNG|nr:hypothetical protein LY90DRAFT_697310 [Neocallimastix californiae]|eukprot:ORY83360.1 hypothetical protein LY90DRAFT_697310 [Neocallimastix californiae]